MKRIRGILALVLVFVMSLSVLGGCSKKTKETMFTVMEDAAAMTNYRYEINMDIKSSIDNLDNIAVKFNGETDGKAATMGIKVSYLYFTFGIDNLLTITKDAMYINVEEIFTAVAPFVFGTDYTLEDLEEEFGVKLRCVQLPLVDGMVSFEKNEDLSKLMSSIFEAALKDVEIQSEKNVYTARIEGTEALSKVADAFLTGVIDNKEAIISGINEQNKLDENTVKAMLDLYIDDIIAAFKKINTEYDMGYTEEEIEELRKAQETEFENALSNVDLNDVSSAYDEAFDKLEEQKEEFVNAIANSKDVDSILEIKDSMTGKEGSRVYSCEVKFEFEDTVNDEDLKLNAKSNMTEDKSISIKAPESYTSFSELFYAALVFTYENGLLDEIIQSVLIE